MPRHDSAVAAAAFNYLLRRLQDVHDVFMKMNLQLALAETAAGQRAAKGIVRKKPAKKRTLAKKKTLAERKRYRDAN